MDAGGRTSLCQWGAGSGFYPDWQPDLIAGRTARGIDIPPYGTLSDYVPFYFTPFTPMLYNTRTGYSGITTRRNIDIVILVSSLPRLHEFDLQFVVSDRHAYASMAQFTSDMADLPRWIPWALLQARDFSRDPERPDKLERYQAEALVYQHLPAEALLGIIVNTDEVAENVRQHARTTGVSVDVHVKPGWYFR